MAIDRFVVGDGVVRVRGQEFSLAKTDRRAAADAENILAVPQLTMSPALLRDVASGSVDSPDYTCARFGSPSRQPKASDKAAASLSCEIEQRSEGDTPISSIVLPVC